VEIDCGDPKNVYIKDGMIMLLSDSEIDSYDTTGNLLATAEASSEYVDFTYFNSNVYFLGYREINKIAFNT
jgi:hypothetical protein